MKNTILLSTLFLGLAFTSCHKKDSNAPTPPSVHYKIAASNKSYGVAKTTAVANIVWTSGYAIPREIKFEAKQNNVSVEYKSTNNDPIDLMSSVNLTFGDFTLPAGSYNEIELKIKLDKNGSEPAMQLNGQLTSGLLSLPIVLQITEPIEIKTEQHNVVITNDYTYLAATTLDLQAITSGVTTSLLLDAELTGGSIVISKESNRGLYNIVVDNLRNKHHHCEFEGHHH